MSAGNHEEQSGRSQASSRSQARSRSQPFTIVAIGEVLWDVFPTGPRFGGAPANFACAVSGVARDSATVEMVSGVGKDALGAKAIESLRGQNVGTQFVSQLEQQTGQVLISLDEQGVATYEFAEDCAWDNMAWSNDLSTLAEAADVVCYGTLGQREEVSRATIQDFVRATKPAFADCLRVFDVNLRPPFYSDAVIWESLKLANVLKLNDEELPLLADLLGVADVEACTSAELAEGGLLGKIANAAELDVVALTRGSNGAMIFKNGETSDFAGIETEVADTVGAGDAFTAAMVVGLLREEPIDVINRRACEVAAFVCSQPGATPKLPTRFTGR